MRGPEVKRLPDVVSSVSSAFDAVGEVKEMKEENNRSEKPVDPKSSVAKIIELQGKRTTIYDINKTTDTVKIESTFLGVKRKYKYAPGDTMGSRSYFNGELSGDHRYIGR